MIDEKQYKLTKEDAQELYLEAVRDNPGAGRDAIIKDARQRVEAKQRELDEAYRRELYKQIVDDAE